jgi:predicted MPP superfamily phosphohydrolase
MKKKRVVSILLISLAGAVVWVAVAAVGVLVWARFVAPSRVRLETVEIEAKGWPGGGGGELRIAFFSDLDLAGAPAQREERVLELVCGLEPDVIAVGGDLLGSVGSPTQAIVDALASWLGEVAACAPHGVLVVWGEQDVHEADRLLAAFPPGVRSLEESQVVLPAGEAKVRFSGTRGHFAPLHAVDGRLRGGAGLSETVALYRGEGSDEWTSLEVTARFLFGLPGDGPGLAVLGGPEAGGLVLRLSPRTAEWGAYGPDRTWEGRKVQRGSLPSRAWIRARVRVTIGPDRTRVESRAWPEAQREPDRWTSWLERKDPGRPRGGSVGLALGGREVGQGRHEWDEISVRDEHGTLLLEETFDDPEAFRAQWDNPGGPPDGFDATVLLLHNPRDMVGIGRQPFLDLTLAGHTHGGQVRLPPFGPVIRDEELPLGWISGQVRLNHGRRWLYVSRGVGTSTIPMRLFCPPEVTDLTLRVIPQPDR